MQLAVKTLAAIDAALKADQGNAFRMWLGRVLPHMGDVYRQDSEEFRSHLGASVLGGKCARAIWYGFRWTTAKRFEGRMIRLFGRGHLEEARFISLLLMIRCEVYQQDEQGKQFRISAAGGHVGGSGDGKVMGLPDLAPGTVALTEFKTHNDKSFKAVQAQGVRAAKFEHFVQMQLYMLKMGHEVTLYGAVNKNDDHLHLELIVLDSVLAEQYLDRGVKLVPMRAPPPKIGSAASFDCKFCDHRPVCQLGAPPERNCRTCYHARADVETGKWWCDSHERHLKMLLPAVRDSVFEPGETFELTKARQLTGCPMWAKNTAAYT